MLLGVQHTCFISRKIDELYEFYTKLPGVKIITDMYILDDYVIKSLSGYKNARTKMFVVQVGKDEVKPQNDLNISRIEFIQYLDPVGKEFDLEDNSAGNAHIGMFTDSIEEDYEKLSGKGVKFSSKPIKIESEGNSMNGVKVAYFKDPEGRTVELMEFPEE